LLLRLFIDTGFGRHRDAGAENKSLLLLFFRKEGLSFFSLYQVSEVMTRQGIPETSGI
jgi:hypothetical protein